MEYKFVKNCNTTLLTQELSTLPINQFIQSITKSANVIVITFSKSLNEKEWQQLYKAIESHNPPSLEEQMTKDKVLSAIAFGQSIIVEVATENIMLKLSTNDILYMLTKFAGIKAMLESGSLYTALATLQNVKPDFIMTQERLNKYINKLKAYLGVK